MTVFRNLIVLFFFAFGAASGFAGEGEKKSEIASTLKEIFLKGSINGDKLFMVLGFENGKEVFKDSLQAAIDIDDLRDLGSDTARTFSRTGKYVWNKEHDGDIIGNVGDAAKYSVENIPNIIQSPWKSLKKIPGSYKVSMQQARESRANASNSVFGATQFAGHAVWANVKGAYYLVIEAPAKFVGNLASTALAVPGVIALEAIGIPLGFTIGIGMKAIRVGWQASKAIVAGAIGIGALTYSAISTTAAASATLLAAGAIGAVKITLKVVSFPFTIGRKVRTRLNTDVNYKRLKEYAAKLISTVKPEYLEAMGLDSSAAISNIKEYKGKIKFLSNKTKKKKVGLTLNVGIEFNSDKSKQNLEVSGFVGSKHFKAMKKVTDVSSEALTTLMREIMKKIINESQTALLAE